MGGGGVSEGVGVNKIRENLRKCKDTPYSKGEPGNDHINNKWSRGWVWEVRVGEGGGGNKIFRKN